MLRWEAPSSGGKKSHAWLNVILNVICSDLHFHSRPAREYYLLLVLELHLLLFMEKGRCRVYKFQVKYFEFFRHVGLTYYAPHRSYLNMQFCYSRHLYRIRIYILLKSWNIHTNIKLVSVNNIKGCNFFSVVKFKSECQRYKVGKKTTELHLM